MTKLTNGDAKLQAIQQLFIGKKAKSIVDSDAKIKSVARLFCRPAGTAD